MLHQIKAPQFYTDLGLQKTVLNPLANGKIQGLFKAFECFSSTFQGKFYVQDFSRQSCIFKYFQSLWEPCGHTHMLFSPYSFENSVYSDQLASEAKDPHCFTHTMNPN